MQHLEDGVCTAQARVEECNRRFHESTGIKSVAEDGLSKEEKMKLKNMKKVN